MATKDLHTRLTGDSGSLEGAMNRGAASMSRAEREARKLEQQQARVDRAMQTVGRGMIVAGAAIAAGLGFAIKAAIDWESAWAGVLKTVDGTDAQMAALEQEIRDLTAVLPASHQEIAAVAEAAGQLGIQRENVAEFTRTMIDLGIATNLSAEEAAVALARLSNIMQTAPDDVDRLGAALVDLGNNAATTESEIVDMALRIAAAGQTIGLSEAEVLGFATALSSVGVRASAGGTAISRAFITIEQAVRDGGDELEAFAEVAGMSASQFQQAYQRDAAGAIATFVEGLGRIQATGGDVFQTLEQLGLSEVRVRDALLRLAGAGDLLNQSLQVGNRGWDENTALLEEAERRYGTVEARMQVAKNQLNDFAISMGQTFLPAVGKAADVLATIAGALADLPGPVQVVLGVLAALAATLLLAGGAMLLLIPRIHQTQIALDRLAATSTRAAAAVGVLRTAIGFLTGPWGVAIALAVGVATAAFTAWSFSAAQSAASAKEVADTLDEMTGAFTDATRALVAHKLEEEGALDAARSLGVNLSDLVDILLEGGDVMAAWIQLVNDANNGIVIQDGHLKRAGASAEEYADKTRAFAQVQDAIGGVSGELDEGVAQWERTNEATGEAASAFERLDPATRDLGDAFGVAAGAAGDVADAVDDLDQELNQLFDTVFGLQNAQDDLTQKLREAKELFQENGGAIEGNTEAAIDNRRKAQELLEAYGALALETIKATGSQEEAEAAAKSFEDALDDLEQQTGVNIREIDGYNDIVDEIDRLIQVTFESPGVQDAIDAARRLKEQQDRIDRFVRIVYQHHQEGAAPAPGPGGEVLRQHGGPVFGPPGPDRVRARLTAGEFVIRREVAQQNMAALTALNATGRFPLAGGIRETRDPVGPSPAGGGVFEGSLVLDSGEFLGKVRGVVRQGISEHNRDVKQAVLAGAGRAR